MFGNYCHFLCLETGVVILLSFACPKERNKEKGSQIQMLRWIWHPHAQVAELLALLFTMTVTFFLNVSSLLLRESF